MMPSVRFATTNYFRGGWHPLGFIGIGQVPKRVGLEDAKFDSPAFDDSLQYKVPEKLRMVEAPPAPEVKMVRPWKADPKGELINPSRYWSLGEGGKPLEKEILNEGGRVIRVIGDFGNGSSLKYDFGNSAKLERGRYRFSFRVRGTHGANLEFEIADDWRGVSKEARISLTKDWEKHRVEFEITNEFKDHTTLRFNLPKDMSGCFDLGEPSLMKVE
jgi:hypothetical protein